MHCMQCAMVSPAYFVSILFLAARRDANVLAACPNPEQRKCSCLLGGTCLVDKPENCINVSSFYDCVDGTSFQPPSGYENIVKSDAIQCNVEKLNAFCNLQLQNEGCPGYDATARSVMETTCKSTVASITDCDADCTGAAYTLGQGPTQEPAPQPDGAATQIITVTTSQQPSDAPQNPATPPEMAMVTPSQQPSDAPQNPANPPASQSTTKSPAQQPSVTLQKAVSSAPNAQLASALAQTSIVPQQTVAASVVPPNTVGMTPDNSASESDNWHGPWAFFANVAAVVLVGATVVGVVMYVKNMDNDGGGVEEASFEEYSDSDSRELTTDSQYLTNDTQFNDTQYDTQYPGGSGDFETNNLMYARQTMGYHG